MMKTILTMTFAAVIATGPSVAMAQNISDYMKDKTLWSNRAGAPKFCYEAAETLDSLHSETDPSERYKSALQMRQCLQFLKAEELSNRNAQYNVIAARFEPNFDENDRMIEKFKNQESFRGISFGVGVGVSFSDDDIISSADIAADSTIRATKEETTEPRVILESHYYGFCSTDACNEGRFGVGPYFGIVAKNDDLISAFSAGIMFGWKDDKEKSSAGFSVGLGALLDSDIKSLASGFEEGQSLPTGETQIRFKTESRWSGILFFTRTF